MPSANPAITVTIPAYNNEPVIAETIQSVLDQTFEDFELIIVNDGSTDRTEEVIKSFKDARIHYYTQENRGASDATNQAILKSRGKYIAILAGDDVCYPDRFQKEYDYLERTGAKAVFSWVDFIGDNSQILTGEHFAKNWFNHAPITRPQMLHHFFFNSNFLCTTTALIDRQVLIDSGLFRLTSAQLPDFTMWLTLIKKYELHILEEKLLKYRIRGDGENISGPSNNGRAYFEAVQIYRQMFDGVPVELFKEAFQDFIRKPDFSDGIEYELEKAFLYLKYDGNLPQIRTIGAEKLFNLLEDRQVLAVSERVYNFGIPQLYLVDKQVDVRGEHYQELEEWSKNLEAEYKKISRQHKGLEDNYHTLEGHYKGLEDNYRTLEGQHKKTVQELQGLAQRFGKEREALKVQLNQSLTEIEAKKAELSSTQLKFDKLTQNLETTQYTLELFEKDLRSLQATRAVRYSQAIGQLGKQLRGTRSSILGSVDKIQISQTGQLNVVGWVHLNHTEVEKVLVKLNETVLGEADYGLARPDVSAATRNKGMLNCGFKALLELDMTQIAPGTKTISVEVYAINGSTYQLAQLPLLARVVKGN